jgi:hypothetical protein
VGDVAEKYGQLRFVVGAHAFARGTPLGFGAHIQTVTPMFVPVN